MFHQPEIMFRDRDPQLPSWWKLLIYGESYSRPNIIFYPGKLNENSYIWGFYENFHECVILTT